MDTAAQEAQLVKNIAELESRRRELQASEDAGVGASISFVEQLLKDKRRELATLRYQRETR
ncbi:MAG: hypothetical protein ACI8PT_004238 [Gammaproteobacteria bacterium]|jgi:hypothetical protein